MSAGVACLVSNDARVQEIMKASSQCSVCHYDIAACLCTSHRDAKMRPGGSEALSSGPPKRDPPKTRARSQVAAAAAVSAPQQLVATAVAPNADVPMGAAAPAAAPATPVEASAPVGGSDVSNVQKTVKRAKAKPPGKGVADPAGSAAACTAASGPISTPAPGGDVLRNVLCHGSQLLRRAIQTPRNRRRGAWP